MSHGQSETKETSNCQILKLSNGPVYPPLITMADDMSYFLSKQRHKVTHALLRFDFDTASILFRTLQADMAHRAHRETRLGMRRDTGTRGYATLALEPSRRGATIRRTAWGDSALKVSLRGQRQWHIIQLNADLGFAADLLDGRRPLLPSFHWRAIHLKIWRSRFQGCALSQRRVEIIIGVLRMAGGLVGPIGPCAGVVAHWTGLIECDC